MLERKSLESVKADLESQLSAKCEIELLSNLSSSTARGLLSKAWYRLGNDLCLVKGNSCINGVIGWEPYSEVMAFKIGKLLGFNCIPYCLNKAVDFSIVQVNGIKHVSACMNFLKAGEDLVKFSTYVNLYKSEIVHDNIYESLVEGAPFAEDLRLMLLFDALIGNEDRHLNNIDLIFDGSPKYRMAPIYDCGASLLSWVPDSEILCKSQPYRYDKAKPFRTNHKAQLNLIKATQLVDRFRSVHIDDILSCINDELLLLPENRRDGIQEFLTWRLNKLKEMIVR